MAVSQEKIAAELGLSRQAVNFALGRRSGQVSDETRRRVHEAARRLGYRANAAARAMKTGRFNAVGLLMSRHHCQSTVFGQMLRGIHDVLDEQGVHLTITFVDDERLTSGEKLPKILRQAMVDGLLLNYTHGLPPGMVELIDRHHIPAVWVNSKQPFNCVRPDDEGAGYAATKLLLAKGHRLITYVDFTVALEDAGEPHYSRFDRRAGYERAMREAGHEPLAYVATRRLAYQRIVNAALELLDSPNRPSAIVCYAGGEAGAFLQACAARGLRLGPDLSLVMVESEVPLVGPKIDIMQLPEFEIGQAAARMLLQRCETSSDMPCEALALKHRPGETVSPVTRGS
jgi:LacI family transcriptional regulator